MILACNVALGASTPWNRIRCKRARYQGGEPSHEFQRRHDDLHGAVPVGTLQLQHDLACASTLSLATAGRVIVRQPAFPPQGRAR